MAEIKHINVGGELYDLVARSNRNLLDNGDFRNPVNQRGKIKYTGAGYTIDRWRTDFSGDSVEVVSGGVKNTVLSTSGGWHLYQNIEEGAPNWVGRTVTASFMIVDFMGTGIYPVISFRNSEGNEIGAAYKSKALSTGLIFFSGIVPAGTVTVRVGFFATSGVTSGDYVTISRAKLEFGSVSTLENDPPMDYVTELAKCQRYYYSTGNDNMAFIGDVGADAKNIRVTILLPTEMRSDAPTTVLTSSNSYVVTSSITKSVGATLSVASTKRIGNSLFVTLTPLSAPLVNTTAYTLCLFQSAFTVSADL